MERKRRERINNCLEQLAIFLKEVNLVAPDKPVAKIEKADILELTVRHLLELKKKPKATREEQQTSKAALSQSLVHAGSSQQGTASSSSSNTDKGMKINQRENFDLLDVVSNNESISFDSHHQQENSPLQNVFNRPITSTDKSANSEFSTVATNDIKHFQSLLTSEVSNQSHTDLSDSSDEDSKDSRSGTGSFDNSGYVQGYQRCMKEVQELFSNHLKSDKESVQRRLVDHLSKYLERLNRKVPKTNFTGVVPPSANVSSEKDLNDPQSFNSRQLYAKEKSSTQPLTSNGPEGGVGSSTQFTLVPTELQHQNQKASIVRLKEEKPDHRRLEGTSGASDKILFRYSSLPSSNAELPSSSSSHNVQLEHSVNINNSNYKRNYNSHSIPTISPPYKVKNHSKVEIERRIPQMEKSFSGQLPVKTINPLDQPSSSGYNYQLHRRQPLRTIQNQNIIPSVHPNAPVHPLSIKHARNFSHPYNQPSSSRQQRQYVDENNLVPQNRPPNVVQNNLVPQNRVANEVQNNRVNEHNRPNMWRPW